MSEVVFFSVPPRPELAPFVEAIWGVRGVGRLGAEAVVPNGAIELMVNFGPVQRVVARGDRALRESYECAWLAGIHDRQLVHSSDLGADHIAVRFRPGGAHAFFDLRMDEAANAVVDLDLVIGREAHSLRDRLGDLRTDGARIEAFQAWLVGRCRVESAFSMVDRAVQILRRRDLRTPVGAMCDALGISNKHLVDRFRRIVGLPPKVLGRILRFQRVVEACREADGMRWSDVAHDAGYADQSHLIREFRRLAGVTPSEFLARRSSDPTHPAGLDG